MGHGPGAMRMVGRRCLPLKSGHATGNQAGRGRILLRAAGPRGPRTSGRHGELLRAHRRSSFHYLILTSTCIHLTVNVLHV